MWCPLKNIKLIAPQMKQMVIPIHIMKNVELIKYAYGINGDKLKMNQRNKRWTSTYLLTFFEIRICFKECKYLYKLYVYMDISSYSDGMLNIFNK